MSIDAILAAIESLVAPIVDVSMQAWDNGQWIVLFWMILPAVVPWVIFVNFREIRRYNEARRRANIYAKKARASWLAAEKKQELIDKEKKFVAIMNENHRKWDLERSLDWEELQEREQAVMRLEECLAKKKDRWNKHMMMLRDRISRHARLANKLRSIDDRTALINALNRLIEQANQLEHIVRGGTKDLEAERCDD